MKIKNIKIKIPPACRPSNMVFFFWLMANVITVMQADSNLLFLLQLSVTFFIHCMRDVTHHACLFSPENIYAIRFFV